MARKNKKRQTRLTFEPTVATASSSQATPSQATSANVRYAKSTAASSSSGTTARTSPLGHTTHSSEGRSNKSQSKLQATVASFMPKFHGSKRLVVDDDSDSGPDVDSVVHDQKKEDNVPIRSSQSVSTKLQNTVLDDDNDDDDDDDDEPIAPPSTLKRRRPVIALDNEDSSDDDDDDHPIVPPSSLKRPRSRFVELEDSSDSDVSPVKKRKTSVSTPGRLRRPNSNAPSSPTKRGAPKHHRSEKQKKLELLRRRRAGEKIDKLTSSESSSEDDKRGLYDTDSEEEFVALKEFDDEESDDEKQEEEEKPTKQRSRRKEKEAVAEKDQEDLGDQEEEEEGGDDGDEKDLEDFISDDDDAPLGAPVNLDIPLEFTAQAHRPLKYQFPYVIEWLVHNRINPAFERHDPVYANAWRKLDDEVRALASSKFASSAWKIEFYRTLKGRPKMEAYEMDRSERSGGLYDTCDACGRSNHPASFRIIFQGHPYYKSTLADVESDTEDSEDDDDDDDESDAGSVDTQGMTLPPVTREWHVGVVCCSNAETAHSLIHWKHALKEWVEERLEDDGWMAAAKLKERERMKARKRRDLANRIVDGWREKGIVAALYKDFKNTLESARNKTTSGRNGSRWR
ncbi:uncharacterized protein F4812DRAFT_439755 [Daldinia caldariorum]|uniref:uncharacterized protein n=1 Tax=Daldinia caldariorum TaxID=326644 RepID=UPI002007540D|nr:uncharacterized protein F4812DRAFT_439755 [Daldinia caldariorum]KAI1465150.1 hypothetical protein F4812DRAFT_439755 [Daldinia caldariorum]